jgi:hypothetical protein
MVIADRIRVHGEELYGHEKMLTVRQNSRVMYDLDSVFSSIPARDIQKIVTVHKSRLEKYLRDERPDLKKKISDAASFSFNAPFFVVKGLGGNKHGNKKDKEKKEG